MQVKITYTTGFAGTGKSTKLLDKLDRLPSTTVVLAPTHKALDRLRKEYGGSIEMKTIHSLLGLIPTINEEASHISSINTLIKLDRSLEDYSDIVIDEAGMISEEHFLDLVGKLEEKEPYDKYITLHLFLDPYQLLPVKGYQISVPKCKQHINSTEELCPNCGEMWENLTTQYRSESPDVVRQYTKFVNYLIGTNTDDLSVEYSENIVPFNLNSFKQGDRLLAYTNKAVGNYNKILADKFGIKSYEGQDVQLGSEGVFRVEKFHQNLDFYELLTRYKNKTLIFQNSNLNEKYLDYALNALVDEPNISFIEMGLNVYPVICGIGHANEVLKQAGKDAIKDRKKFARVYTLNRAFIMDYTFCSTVHKAQGQEFDTVFIDKEDIQCSIVNNYYETYARLMYVGISRCKKTLYI